jgi:hypothetical protein
MRQAPDAAHIALFHFLEYLYSLSTRFIKDKSGRKRFSILTPSAREAAVDESHEPCGTSARLKKTLSGLEGFPRKD